MLRVYIAGAYNSHDVKGVLDNMRKGLRLSIQVLKSGFAPFSPWLDYTFGIMEDISVEEFKAYSMEWLMVSEAVLLVPGWEESEGTKAEIAEAKRLGIPIFESFISLLHWGKQECGQ